MMVVAGAFLQFATSAGGLSSASSNDELSWCFAEARVICCQEGQKGRLASARWQCGLERLSNSPKNKLATEQVEFQI